MLPCTYTHVSAKVHKIRGTQIQSDPSSVRNVVISPTRIRRRPQNMLERSESLADWTQHHVQEKQGISPHVSGSSSNHLNYPGCLSHWNSHHWSGSKNFTAPPSLHLWEYYVFMFVLYRSLISVLVLFSVRLYWVFRNFRLLENQKIHYFFCINPILCQLNPSHTLTLYFLKIHFIVILPFPYRCHNCPLPSTYWD
jgi:hypothetical protein